jgi:hypothetical protein
VAKKSNAATCTTGNQCSSGNCVGGYCCGQAACSDTCGTWSACSYPDACSNTGGTQSQTCTSYTCSTGTCTSKQVYTNTAGCYRNTEGNYCGSFVGDWGYCGRHYPNGECSRWGIQYRADGDMYCSNGTCSVEVLYNQQVRDCPRDPTGEGCNDGDYCTDADTCDSSGACIGTPAWCVAAP